MKITWYGTACIELESGDTKILFDPFVPMRKSGVPVALADFDGYRHILITHGHFDHIESIPAICKRNPETLVHCTAAPYDTLRKKGVPEKQLRLMSKDETFRIVGEEYIPDPDGGSSEGFAIRTYQGSHAVLGVDMCKIISDGLKYHCLFNLPHIAYGLLAYPENGETLFYEINAEGKRIFLMGSLNIDPDTEYPEVCDLMVLPYNGWEDNFPHAVEITERLKPAKILADHYDPTFRPATSDLDLTPIVEHFGDKLILIKQKESITL